MPTVWDQTLLHQRKAREHAYEAQYAVARITEKDDFHYDQALHHQSMSRFHAERAWIGLLSLSLGDPII